MRKKLLVIISLLLIRLVSYGQEPEQLLQLTIKADKKVYEIGEAIWIEALITDNSGKEHLLFSPALQISSDNFKPAIYSPLMFIDNGFQRNPHKVMGLILKPKKTIRIKYNLYDLKWDYIISSLWASKEFNTYVQPGKYSIFFSVVDQGEPIQKGWRDTTLGANNAWTGSLNSNTITIEIAKKPTWNK